MKAFEALQGGLRLLTGDGAFPLSTDTVLLADFVRLSKQAAVCDLGCGGGAAALLLCARSDCRVTGVELQEDACAIARENVRLNGLAGRFSVLRGDLREIRTLLPAGGFTHVVSNPPYFDTSNPAAPDAGHAAARSELFCTPAELCAAAAWLLRSGGTFSVVYRPERLCDLICALRAAAVEPKRIRFVRHRPDAPLSLTLLEARRGGKPGLRYEPDLILFGADGAPTAEYRRIYHLEGGA